MEKYKISVIISIYNTEKYLEKCLESLLSQTYQNMELILIEDGSTDNSKDILKKYEKDKKCHVIYNDGNKGLAYSRNVGMKEATGDYLGFIDSDDYVEKEYYENLMNAILNDKADVAICDINLVFEKSKTNSIRKCCEGKWNIVNIINNGMAASACNKLFKKELISQYQFAVGKVNEDIAVVIPTLVKAKKVSYTKDCVYNYVQRENSIQNRAFSLKRFDIFEAVDTTLERIKDCSFYEEIKDALVFNQIMLLLFYVIPKDKRFFYRQKVLKQFAKLSRKYDIRQNKSYWQFSSQCGKKHALYYRMLLKFECNHMYLFANLLIVMYKLASKILRTNVIKKEIEWQDLFQAAKNQKLRQEEEIKVSAVIPNYNYEKFLKQRLYSILNQDYKLHEIIILDDCSKDNSRELIDEMVKQLSSYINIKKIYNTTNSGSAFKQWKVGFENATGDYVWIAEADDYCDKHLLVNLVKPIKQQKDIFISYADTAFIDTEGTKIMNSVKQQIDLRKTGHWNQSYINDGVEEIKNFTFLNCTIANVSSCIIKNGDYHEALKLSGEYKQSGDWLFYVNVMKNGKIAYTDKVLNYYRIHGNNVSETMNHKKHIEEIQKIHSIFVTEFKLNEFHKKEMQKRIGFLKENWEEQ